MFPPDFWASITCPYLQAKACYWAIRLGYFSGRIVCFVEAAGGRDGKRLYCNIEYCIHIYIAGYE